MRTYSYDFNQRKEWLNQGDKICKWIIWFDSKFESCDLNQAISGFESHNQR